MKHIFILLIATTFSLANYSIHYNGVELGQIKDFTTLKDNYLKAEVSNSVARFFIGRDYVILYDKNFNLPKNKDKYKYKKEKSQIITLLQKAYAGTLEAGIFKIDETKNIEIKIDENYKFIFRKRGKIKSEGYFIMKDGELVKFIENENDIEIVKN